MPCSSLIALPKCLTERISLVRLAALCVVALGLLPGAARAQCNGSSNPPPAGGLPYNYANQSFGNTPPLAPYTSVTNGIPGCNGPNGGDNQAGGNGLPGQQGGPINSTNTNLTIYGGGNPAPGSLATSGAFIQSLGGPGGAGGGTGYVGQAGVIGGNGATGGQGGQITVSFDGTFVPDSSGHQASYGIWSNASGSGGGMGGTPSNQGIFYKAAGNGGNGGAGGSVALVASGSIQALNGGVFAQAIGGGGGGGGDALSVDQLDDTTGGNGGNGGNGGTSSVTWLSGPIKSSEFGIAGVASGGNGGLGGFAAPSVSTTGGNGGAGGNGGNATVEVGSGAITVSLGTAGISVEANGGNGGNGGQAGAALERAAVRVGAEGTVATRSPPSLAR